MKLPPCDLFVSMRSQGSSVTPTLYRRTASAIFERVTFDARQDAMALRSQKSSKTLVAVYEASIALHCAFCVASAQPDNALTNAGARARRVMWSGFAGPGM